MIKRIFKFKKEVTEGWTDDGLNAYNGLIVALGSAIACFTGWLLHLFQRAGNASWHSMGKCTTGFGMRGRTCNLSKEIRKIYMPRTGGTSNIP